jgi:hypothetical protein
VQVLDYLAPFNQQLLGNNDLDLGSGGVMLLPEQSAPHRYLALVGTKQGFVYLLDRDRLTANDEHQVSCPDAAESATGDVELGETWTVTCDPVVQVFETRHDENKALASSPYRGRGVFSTPAYWNGFVYLGVAGDALKMFAVRDGLIANDPVSVSPNTFAWPGPTPSVSANGDTGGIVWVVDSGDTTGGPAVLSAFDAMDVSRVLYRSSGTEDEVRAGVAPPEGRDTLSTACRFIIPTVYAGKVFVATRTALHVFGLL